jgi:predicted RNA-binding protein with PIN domain
MNILIDGYNLLKQVFGGQITEQQRRQFELRALEYAQRKGHVLYIVYDGGPYSQMTVEKRGRVSCVYSGYKDTADDILKQYIEEGILKHILLVSTDRQLNAFADRYGVPSIDALDFYSYMKETKAQVHGYKKIPGQAHKLNPEESSPELDALMEEGASTLFYKEEALSEEVAHTVPSKKEKRLLALLKKL